MFIQWMSDSSNWARARLISSCMKRSSSILASFFASADLDRTRRRSSTDKRDFREGPALHNQRKQVGEFFFFFLCLLTKTTS